MKGRYINIVIPGKKQYLTLCEVEVIGQPSDDPDVHGKDVFFYSFRNVKSKEYCIETDAKHAEINIFLCDSPVTMPTIDHAP